VLSVVEAVVLRPEVIVAAVNEAVRRLRPPDQPNDERQRLQAVLAQTERELRNLVQAVAAGGETATLVEAVKQRERDRGRVQRELAMLDAFAAVGPTDLADLRHRLEHHLETGEGSCSGTYSRPGRLYRSYSVAGVGRLEPLLTGVLPIPKTMVTPGGSCR